MLFQVILMDLGYVTHAVHANSRMVYLITKRQEQEDQTISITGPPDGNVYPPGPGWLYIVADGVPSEGRKVIIGDGRGPPVDEGAIRK